MGDCTPTLRSAGSLSAQVCELDIIFNFEKAYFILDEFLMGGDVQDTSKKSVLKAIEQADLLQEVWGGGAPRGKGLLFPQDPRCLPPAPGPWPPLPMACGRSSMR